MVGDSGTIWETEEDFSDDCGGQYRLPEACFQCNQEQQFQRMVAILTMVQEMEKDRFGQTLIAWVVHENERERITYG